MTPLPETTLDADRSRRNRGLLLLPVLFLALVLPLSAQAKGDDPSNWPMSRGGGYNRGDAASVRDITNRKARWEYIAVSNITAEPVVADGVVYVHDHASVVHAIELKTGKKRWSSAPRVGKSTKKEIDARALGDISTPTEKKTDNACTHSAPLVAGDRVISATESGVVTAYRLRDGKVMWEHDLGVQVFSSPRVFEGRVLLGALDRKFRAFDLETGKELWSYECGDIIGSTPAISRSGKAYVMCNDKSLYVLDCRTGKLRKTMEVGYRSNSHLCFAEAMVFMVCSGRRFVAYDVVSGETQWFAENPATSYIQSAVYRDGFVYVQMGPSLRCYRTKDGRKMWETPIGEAGGYTPTLGKDCVYLRSKAGLRLFDMKTGEIRFQLELPAPTFAPPVIVGERVIVTDGNGVVRAF